MKGMPNIPKNHPDHQALVAYVVSLKRPADPESHPVQPSPPPSEGPAKSDPQVVHKLSAAEKAHVLDGDFTIEKNVDRLPDGLKSAFAHLAKEADFKMANPGEEFPGRGCRRTGIAVATINFRRNLKGQIFYSL